jgi:hypothetical protein
MLSRRCADASPKATRGAGDVYDRQRIYVPTLFLASPGTDGFEPRRFRLGGARRLSASKIGTTALLRRLETECNLFG